MNIFKRIKNWLFGHGAENKPLKVSAGDVVWYDSGDGFRSVVIDRDCIFPNND